jgi:hypothetical protein
MATLEVVLRIAVYTAAVIIAFLPVEVAYVLGHRSGLKELRQRRKDYGRLA